MSPNDNSKSMHPMGPQRYSQRCWLQTCCFVVSLAGLLMSGLLLGRTPARADDTIPSGAAAEQTSPWTGTLDTFWSFLSRADGHRCPMVPSCSQYARQALQQYGLIRGWVLTCDRLLRCGRDEIHLAPVIRINGTAQAYDPLGANTFWWKQK